MLQFTVHVHCCLMRELSTEVSTKYFVPNFHIEKSVFGQKERVHTRESLHAVRLSLSTTSHRDGSATCRRSLLPWLRLTSHFVSNNFGSLPTRLCLITLYCILVCGTQQVLEFQGMFATKEKRLKHWFPGKQHEYVQIAFCNLQRRLSQ